MCKGWWFLFNVEIIHILVKIIYTLTYTSEKLIVRKFKRKIDIIQIKNHTLVRTWSHPSSTNIQRFLPLFLFFSSIARKRGKIINPKSVFSWDSLLTWLNPNSLLRKPSSSSKHCPSKAAYWGNHHLLSSDSVALRSLAETLLIDLADLGFLLVMEISARIVVWMYMIHRLDPNL